MLGDSITFKDGGSSGTSRTLTKINQDNYSSEYLYRGATENIRLQVRHSKDSVKAGQPARERHNFSVSREVFPTESAPSGFTETASFTVVMAPTDSVSAVTNLGLGVVDFMTSAHLGQLIGWES